MAIVIKGALNPAWEKERLMVKQEIENIRIQYFVRSGSELESGII